MCVVFLCALNNDGNNNDDDDDDGEYTIPYDNDDDGGKRGERKGSNVQVHTMHTIATAIA